MSIGKKYNVIGLMSGTSIDGIDCSFMTTDGDNLVSIKFEKTYKYSQNYRNKLKKIIKDFNKKRLTNIKQYLKNKEEIVTNKFIQIIKKFTKEYNIKYSSIDYIGISGQTVFHDPKNKKTIQLGSCKKIHKNLKLKIVGNFRENDIKNGGQGAPIAVFYHNYILKNFAPSSVILNLGGIGNISFINKEKLIAFDVGCGNALIDDLMFHFYKKNYDKGGKIAFKGKINQKLIVKYKNDSFFKLQNPKSLDREYFKKYFNLLKKIKKEDAICTASMMTIEGILLEIKKLKINFKSLILTGGGRNNLFVVNYLKKIFKSTRKEIILIDELNFNGDFLEAQAFAYLAIRCVRKLHLSLPTTTGVKKPISGGLIYQKYII